MRIFIFLIVISFTYSITFNVEPRLSECFFEEMKEHDKFDMEFQVIHGGLLDIELHVLDPKNSIIVRKKAYFNHENDDVNAAEGKVVFHAASIGVYQICFNNEMSRWTGKTITFDIKGSKTSPPSASGDSLATIDHLSPMVDSIIQIGDTLSGIKELQKQYRIRETIHRDTQESTNTRVAWMTIIETFILVSIGIAQIYYIHMWFTTDNKPRV